MKTTTETPGKKLTPKQRKAAAVEKRKAAAAEKRKAAAERRRKRAATEHGQAYADAMNKPERGDKVVDGVTVIDDGLDDDIRSAAEAIGEAALGEVGSLGHKAPPVIVGQAYELAAQLRNLAGKHGAKYKERLMRALRDEKDPLFDVLRKAGKRVIARTIMGD